MFALFFCAVWWNVEQLDLLLATCICAVVVQRKRMLLFLLRNYSCGGAKNFGCQAFCSGMHLVANMLGFCQHFVVKFANIC